MSKNTPTTQYLDFNNYAWDLSTVSYTKEFNKFYSKPEGQIIIKNLSIVSTKEEVTSSIMDIIAFTMQVLIDKSSDNSDEISYFTNKIDIEGGSISIDLNYTLSTNTLTAKLTFQADTSVLP